MNFLQNKRKIFNSLVRSTFSQKLNILGFAILVVLILSSVYSVYSAFVSYLLDNTATNTAIKTLNNSLSLNKYLTIEICAQNDSLFPESWRLNDSEKRRIFSKANLDRFLWSTIEMLDQSNLAFLKDLSASGELSLRHMVGVSLATETISRLEGDFLPAFTKDDVFTENYRADGLNDISTFFKNVSTGLTGFADWTSFQFTLPGVYTPSMISMLDNFIENPDSSDLVDKTISHIITPNFVRLFGMGIRNNTNLPVIVTNDYLSFQCIRIMVPLDNIPFDAPSGRVILGVFPFDDSFHRLLFFFVSHQFAQFDTTLTSSGIVPFNDLSYTHPILLFKTDFTKHGVYDSTAIRSESECRMCENVTDIEHCKFKCLLDSVVDQCRCIPFTFRRLYNSDSNRNFRYCMLTDYGGCLQSVQHDQSRCSSEKVVPCVAHDDELQPLAFGFDSVDEVERNSMVADIYPFIKDDSKYRMYFAIDFHQPMYVTYKEVQQNSCMEFLGQVGGNLGLFLSFSLYGLWRVLILFCATYKNHHEHVAGNGNPARGSVQSWLRTAQMMAESDASKRIRKARCEQIDALLLRMASEEDRFAQVRNRFLEYKLQHSGEKSPLDTVNASHQISRL